MIKKICVFCGSSKPKNNSKIEKDVNQMIKIVFSKKLELIYGGANIGLMGQISNNLLDLGGRVTGVIPKILSKKEIINKNITKLIIVDNMHQRKKTMYDLSDAFIVLPGGIGTLEEFAEVVTWKVLGIHNKKIFVINIEGYYNFLLKQFSVMKDNNFLYTDILQDIIIINKIEDLENHL
ncbi:MAG: TIGR00730 family Rossman fold protein [Cytophagia bacterium]|jgi:uncharacterized protein (TIGR00730 family)|nr:TIGR00730 family Rossman fold protein [Cytophagia bacterium]